jgi:hypothetical protein
MPPEIAWDFTVLPPIVRLELVPLVPLVAVATAGIPARSTVSEAAAKSVMTS